MIKKIILTCLLLVSFQSKALLAPEANAAWRLFIAQKVIPLNLSVVGVSLCRGVIICDILYWPISVMAYGALIVMDEQSSKLKFMRVKPGSLEGVTIEEIVVYNSEVEEVNALVNDFQVELGSEDDTDLIQLKWDEYESYLSPESAKVVQAILRTQVK